MTTELIATLLDQYWDAAFKEGSEGRVHDTQDGNAQSIRTQLIEAFNTRAVPELVRYSPLHTYKYGVGMEENKSGEYVRYDLAAAIIAMEQANFKDMEDSKNYWKKCAHKAEAELAQIKAQVPIGYVSASIPERLKHPSYGGSLYIRTAIHQKSPCTDKFIPLYSSPLSQEPYNE